MTPARCPRCGKPGGLPIVYGMPGADTMEREDVVLGGCVVSGEDPDTACKYCGHRWRRITIDR
jgi:hypothetical protein